MVTKFNILPRVSWVRRIDRYFYYLLLLFIFSIPISQLVSSKLLVVLFIFAFFATDIRNNFIKTLKDSWDSYFYLFVLVCGLFYSFDFRAGFGILETSFSFLALPFVFTKLSCMKDFDQDIKSLFYAFILGLMAACLICLLNAGLLYFKQGDVQVFYFYNLTDVINFQPTYFAYYLIFACTYGLYQSYYQKVKMNRWFVLTCVVFLFFVLMLTGGQTAFISILLIFSFFILKFIIEDENKGKKRVISVVFLMLIGMFLAVLIDKGERGLSLNDAWDRLILWESAIEATPNLFFGVGTGDYKLVLNQYYLAHNLQKFADESYNSHNQFIQLLFSNGLLGITSLFLLLGRPLYMCVKNHSLLGTLLLFPFLIYGVTEVFLGRYQGVVFFVVVRQLCILLVRQTEKPSTREPNYVLIK